MCFFIFVILFIILRFVEVCVFYFYCFVCCVDNVGVIVNFKGEMKGFVIMGFIGKECVDLWLRIVSVVNVIV